MLYTLFLSEYHRLEQEFEREESDHPPTHDLDAMIAEIANFAFNAFSELMDSSEESINDYWSVIQVGFPMFGLDD